jgi:hypothetical protein
VKAFALAAVCLLAAAPAGAGELTSTLTTSLSVFSEIGAH